MVEEGEPAPAVVYVKNGGTWCGTPSEAYCEACRVHVTAFWPARRLEVRDTDGTRRDPETMERRSQPNEHPDSLLCSLKKSPAGGAGHSIASVAHGRRGTHRYR